MSTPTSDCLQILYLSDEEKACQAARDAQVLRLANRLGVQPINRDDAASRAVVFVLTDGTYYDWADLVHASLDAIERAQPA